ncbi:MAG: histone deacetylase [Phycisphaerae bacterium]|nr:histone deacetylase [Phycisphaerae bacterium]
MPKTGLLVDERYQLHDTGPGHPERADRLVAIDRRLSTEGYYKRTERIKPVPAELSAIELVHDREYIARVQATCKTGADYIDTPDSAICPKSYEIAVLAVGGVLELVDAVMAGKCANGFAAPRPPGHHAERKLSMGFCLFNNIAIAARHLQKKHKVGKVLILDWDVHHGNGTQHSTEEDPSIFFCSLHQHPSTCYPGTGYPHETGRGRGAGSVLNIPMAPGLGNDAYREAFEKQFLPAAHKFKPDFILTSAGFDAHARDPLAAMNVTAEGFNYMLTAALDLADTYCNGRYVSILEGGYNLQALAECVGDHVRILIERAAKTDKATTASKPAQATP